MIRLTKINQAPFVLNSDLIEHIEVTPDTVITMTNGQKFVVLEGPSEVVRRVIDFRRSVGCAFHSGCAQPGAGPDRLPHALDSDDAR